VDVLRAAAVRLFWFLWAVDAIVAALVVFFFLVGIADGSVSSFNAHLWALMLAGVGGVVLGSLQLRARGRLQMATKLLWLLAAPGLGIGFFFLVLIVTHPRWN